MKNSLKNFELFLESLSNADNTEETLGIEPKTTDVSEVQDSIESNENNAQPTTDTLEEPTTVLPTPTEALAKQGCCNVLFLHGGVAVNGQDNVNAELSKLLKSKICGEVKEISLYQLNIQPASEVEPMDGMVQVYEAVQKANVIIVCTDLKKGQISSILQTTLERLSNYFKNKELKNKIFGSVITGQEDAYQNVKANLLNFANNMGLVIGNTQAFCCLEDGEKIDECEHDIEGQTTNIANDLKELSHNLCSIQSKEVAPVLSNSNVASIENPILNFDEYDAKEDEAPIEDVATEEEANDVDNIEELLDSEEEGNEEVDADTNSVSEEEEDYFFDYNNNIAYNRSENPTIKPNPVVLGESSNLLNFSDFLKKNK